MVKIVTITDTVKPLLFCCLITIYKTNMLYTLRNIWPMHYKNKNNVALTVYCVAIITQNVQIDVYDFKIFNFYLKSYLYIRSLF